MKGNTGKTTKWITEGRTSQTIWNWTDVTTEVTDQTITEETITDATIANWTEATVTSIANTTDNVNGTMVELSGSFLVYNTLVGYISVLFMCIICLLYLYSVLGAMEKCLLGGEMLGCCRGLFGGCSAHGTSLNNIIAARQREADHAQQQQHQQEPGDEAEVADSSGVAAKRTQVKSSTFAAATMFGGKWPMFERKGVTHNQPKTPKMAQQPQTSLRA